MNRKWASTAGTDAQFGERLDPCLTDPPHGPANVIVPAGVIAIDNHVEPHDFVGQKHDCATPTAAPDYLHPGRFAGGEIHGCFGLT